MVTDFQLNAALKQHQLAIQDNVIKPIKQLIRIKKFWLFLYFCYFRSIRAKIFLNYMV